MQVYALGFITLFGSRALGAVGTGAVGANVPVAVKVEVNEVVEEVEVVDTVVVVEEVEVDEVVKGVVAGRVVVVEGTVEVIVEEVVHTVVENGVVVVVEGIVVMITVEEVIVVKGPSIFNSGLRTTSGSTGSAGVRIKPLEIEEVGLVDGSRGRAEVEI